MPSNSRLDLKSSNHVGGFMIGAGGYQNSPGPSK